jgi:ParB family chromosome partitioning protein
VKKDIMLDALDDIGGPILRGRYKDAKKSELATTCASLCNGQGIVEAEIREKALTWLPDAMRFDAVEKPERTVPHSAFLEHDSDEDEDPEVAGDGDEAEADGDEDAIAPGEEEDLSQAA